MISFTNYINITSGVAGAAVLRAREFITRVFTSSALVPTNSFAEFPSAADVGTYFGFGSPQYARALYYFSFISKLNLSPQKISFASYTPAAVSPVIYGDAATTATLTALHAVTSGSLSLTLGATTATLAAINLSGAASLAAVATILTTAIQAHGGGSLAGWQDTVVSFQPTLPTGASFQLLGGPSSQGTAAGAVAVMVLSPPTVDIGALIGWESPNTIISQGADAQTPVQALNASVAASTNFGSFCFESDLGTADDTLIAQWTDAQNVDFMYLAQVVAEDAAATSAACMPFSGTALTLSPVSGFFPEMIPGMVWAATNYDGPNASQNYMYQPNGAAPASVTDDADQAAYDALRVNYVGITQKAGQSLTFYQRGKLTGGATAAVDMNVYTNEAWFKSGMQDDFITALITLTEIPANNAGSAIVNGIIQNRVNSALDNSVISPNNVPLTQAQINVITGLANNPRAWQQVQSSGYWFTSGFTSEVVSDGSTEWQVVYTLIYAKNNAIRKVIGSHTLI